MAQGMDMGRNRGGKGNSKVLKFPKRRYDGGTEIALIEAIEKKKKATSEASRFSEIKAMEMKTLQEQNKKAWAKTASRTEHKISEDKSEGVNKQSVPVTATQSEPIAQVKATKKQKIFQALIMGPLELCVGMVGVITSLLAIMTFKYFNNEPMETQSKQVLEDCFKTINKGILDTVSMPNYLVKAMFEG